MGRVYTTPQKSPSLEMWAFRTAWEKVPETICFLFSTLHLDVGRCVDTSTGGTDAWQKHLLLSKPVRLR